VNATIINSTIFNSVLVDSSLVNTTLVDSSRDTRTVLDSSSKEVSQESHALYLVVAGVSAVAVVAVIVGVVVESKLLKGRKEAQEREAFLVN